MRQQYHLRPSKRGLLAWDVHRLVSLSAGFPVHDVPLCAIRELDEAFWFSDGTGATCRAVAQHARLIGETDLRYPIILSSDGWVMDGMHRVAKALLEGGEVIKAVQFMTDPEPDFVGVEIDDLPYDDPA